MVLKEMVFTGEWSDFGGPKINRRPDPFESMDARAALPQNCSSTKLNAPGLCENSTEVPAFTHQGAITQPTNDLEAFRSGAYPTIERACRESARIKHFLLRRQRRAVRSPRSYAGWLWLYRAPGPRRATVSRAAGIVVSQAARSPCPGSARRRRPRFKTGFEPAFCGPTTMTSPMPPMAFPPWRWRKKNIPTSSFLILASRPRMVL